MAPVRTTVNLPGDEHDALKALADRRQISFTHALRQAIQSELFIQRLVDENATLVVQTDSGDIQQLVFTQAAPRVVGRAGPEDTTGPVAEPAELRTEQLA
jgi:hypothetical protein